MIINCKYFCAQSRKLYYRGDLDRERDHPRSLECLSCGENERDLDLDLDPRRHIDRSLWCDGDRDQERDLDRLRRDRFSLWERFGDIDRDLSWLLHGCDRGEREREREHDRYLLDS